MYIHVTRYGGERSLRLSTAAIAYIDEAPGGAAIRLIGGESLRVVETPSEIETRQVALFTTLVGEVVTAPREMIADDIYGCVPAVDGPSAPAVLSPKRGKRA